MNLSKSKMPISIANSIIKYSVGMDLYPRLLDFI